jgi:ribbon-helix-helix CopG family protein
VSHVDRGKRARTALDCPTVGRRPIAQLAAVCYIRIVSATLTIRLDPGTAKALEDEAARTRRPRGEIVREALSEHFARRGESALDALGDLVGCMSGPPDLSSSKKHLKGLGKRRRR